jgi:hypothetical protein
MRRISLITAGLVALAFFLAPSASATSPASHGPITISSNSDFTKCKCVTSGTGTASKPFIVGPFTITGPSGGSNGWALKVDNSKGGVTAYFNIFGIEAGYNDTNKGDPTIWLVNVKTTTSITGNSADPTGGNDVGIGIELDNSSNISIDGVDFNKGNGTGIYVNGSSNISINNSKLKATCVICSPHTGDGIYAVNSSKLYVGTGADCPNSNPCNDVTYDDGFGAWLVDTHDSVLNALTSDANDTGGYVLDGSNTYNDVVENSTATGTGNICITFNGQKVNTGYFTDLQGGLHLINGAHNNTITNDSFNGDSFGSTTGLSIASGGNAFYWNACTAADQPFTAEPGMGAGNTFSNLCYDTTNVPGLPPSTCKS